MPHCCPLVKKAVSNSLGLVDFAIGQVNFVLNYPDGQVKFVVKFKSQKNCDINTAHKKVFSCSYFK